MIKEVKLKLAEQYYLENKERYEEFAKLVFENEGAGSNNLFQQIDFNNKFKFYGYFNFPNTTNINILHIIRTLFVLNPKLSNEFIDHFVRAMILETIIHERLHYLQFRPMRFIGKKDLPKNQKVFHYYEDPVCAFTINHIMYNLDEYSNKYKINKEIIRLVVIKGNGKAYVKNKKFRVSSNYNDFKYLLHSHSDYRISRDLELAALGKNYYKSSIVVFINANTSIVIKRGEIWNFNCLIKLHEYLHNKEIDKDIKVISYENFDMNDLHEYIQNNYPGYQSRICNALSRYISSNFECGITKEEMKNYIYEDNAYIRGIGEKSKEILRGFFYTE